MAEVADLYDVDIIFYDSTNRVVQVAIDTGYAYDQYRSYCALLRLSFLTDPGDNPARGPYYPDPNANTPNAETLVEVVYDGSTYAEGTTLDPLDGTYYIDDLTTSAINPVYTLTPAKVWYVAIADYYNSADEHCSRHEHQGNTGIGVKHIPPILPFRDRVKAIPHDE